MRRENFAMAQTFDEAHARYLSSLAQLDRTDGIAEKNVLFRQLAEQLSRMEEGLCHQGGAAQREETSGDDFDLDLRFGK